MITGMRCFAFTLAVAAFAASSALAQIGTSTGEAKKTDANCNTRSTVGNAQSSSSMSIDKSAILPSAGNHANSAAPTVQSDGKAMQARADCPPDTTSPASSDK